MKDSDGNSIQRTENDEDTSAQRFEGWLLPNIKLKKVLNFFIRNFSLFDTLDF